MGKKQQILILSMLMLNTMSMHAGILDWLKGKKKPKIEYHVKQKPAEDMNAEEWLSTFANEEDVQEFNTNAEILAQQIFLGIYPSGWFTDEISLNTLARDSAGMYKRYSDVIGTQKENTVGWFRMINNTWFQIQNAIGRQEEESKIKRVENRRKKKQEVRNLINNLRSVNLKKAHTNLEELIYTYIPREIRWSATEQGREFKKDTPDAWISQLSKGYAFIAGEDRKYPRNFHDPLMDIKQYTVDMYEIISSYLATKQDTYPAIYIQKKFSPQFIQNEDLLLPQAKTMAKNISPNTTERMLKIIREHKKKIDALAIKIDKAHAAILKAIREMPTSWRSYSMLYGSYQAQNIAINIDTAVKRLQFGINNELFVVETIQAQQRQQQKPKQPEHFNLDYKQYLDYINPKSWWRKIWG